MVGNILLMECEIKNKNVFGLGSSKAFNKAFEADLFNWQAESIMINLFFDMAEVCVVKSKIFLILSTVISFLSPSFSIKRMSGLFKLLFPDSFFSSSLAKLAFPIPFLPSIKIA